MSAIQRLAHVCITSTDLERTEAFYVGGLALEKLFAFTRQGQVIGFYLKASPETFIEVFRRDAAAGAGASNLHHFCLETADIKATRQRLLDLGFAAGDIKMGIDQSWQFWIKDPDGVDVEFHEYTPASSQRNGRSVEVDW